MLLLLEKEMQEISRSMPLMLSLLMEAKILLLLGLQVKYVKQQQVMLVELILLLKTYLLLIAGQLMSRLLEKVMQET
jgi:hypothetical protein